MSVYYRNAQPDSEGPGYSERADPSLNSDASGSLDRVFRLTPAQFDTAFLQPYQIGYIVAYLTRHRLEWRVVTHPRQTDTCFEKAALLDWNPLNVIKALYFEDARDGALYAVVVPETGCFVDRDHLATIFGIDDAARLRKTMTFPRFMERGTCSPFIVEDDRIGRGGRVKKIVFDGETLAHKRHDAALDDFSFGLDHRMSIQLNYFHCYQLLLERYGDLIDEADLLTLRFKEILVRNKGRLKITYEFNSLSYRIAVVLNGMHGHGDVSVVNDHVDELDLPGVIQPNDRKAEGR
jgi:hypothetical protein